MHFVYLSTLCSHKEYQRMFEIYGTTSSHASQRFNRLLLRGLVKNGLSVDTISYRSIKHPQIDDLLHSSEIENDICYHYIPHCKINSINRLYTIVSAFKMLIKQRKECVKNHEHLIIGVDTINGELSIATMLFSLFFPKIKTIAIVTDVPTMRANDNRKGFRSIPVKLKNYLISRYSEYVFLTEAMNNELNKKNKPYVVIEGICDDSSLPLEISKENKYKEIVFFFAGLLENEFGINRLLKEFHNIHNENVRLHIYGKGSSETTIKKYQQIDKRICFFGEAVNSKIIEEECKATFLINPRPAHGNWTRFSFPSKNIEYISSGTPLIAYWLPCMPDDYRGRFIEIDDNSFASVLNRCIEMSIDESIDFGLKSREWIVSEKSPQNQTKNLAEMIMRKG